MKDILSVEIQTVRPNGVIMIRDEELLEVPVLVIGAGAAGLAAAITLARYGIECLLVERRHEQSRLPRATVISTRSMELMRSWGLEEEVVGGGVEVEWLMWLCETLAQASAGEAVKVGLPTREQSAMISPTAPACVPQDHLEPVLLAHLRSLEPARVELATELMALESRPTGVRATVRHNRNGHVNVVEAQYLVAADGAYSRVRTTLEIGMDGPDDIVEGVTTIFRAPLWDTLGDHRYGIYAVSQPEASGSFLPAGREDRWVYGFWKPNGLRVPPTEERLTELIRLGAGVPDLRLRIERSAMFSAVAQLADRYRHENVFLAGDAAHRVTPRGGTGMNTAIHDGYDIGWKLAWVLAAGRGRRCSTPTRRNAAPSLSTTPRALPIPTGPDETPNRNCTQISTGGSHTTGSPPLEAASPRSTCSGPGSRSTRARTTPPG